MDFDIRDCPMSFQKQKSFGFENNFFFYTWQMHVYLGGEEPLSKNSSTRHCSSRYGKTFSSAGDTPGGGHI